MILLDVICDDKLPVPEPDLSMYKWEGPRYRYIMENMNRVLAFPFVICSKDHEAGRLRCPVGHLQYRLPGDPCIV